MAQESPRLEIDGATIVVLGSFNPTIFQPLWFSENSLIRKEEAEQAKIEVVHPQVTIFSTDWFRLQATLENFTIETKDPTKLLPLRDIVSGTFAVLEHTPIRQFGMNRYMHFYIPSKEAWHSFGHNIAPKEAWTDLVADPGLLSLVIQGKRKNAESTRLQIKVEPSTQIEQGVFFHANDHYDLLSLDASRREGMKKFLHSLQHEWGEFLTYFNQIPKHLFAKFLKT